MLRRNWRSVGGFFRADKQALLPGQTATFANYTSYSRGINGIMVDLGNLPEGATLDADDFRFKVGNDSDPTGWTPVDATPTITVRAGVGINDSDRVTIIWPDNVIQKQWLQVTVLDTENTGLIEPDVFYFGNAIGESGNSTADAKVNAYDMLIARDNQTHFLNALKLITVPENKADGEATTVGKAAAPAAVLDQIVSSEACQREYSPAKLDWLYEFEPMGAARRGSSKDSPVSAAVDKLLTASCL